MKRVDIDQWTCMPLSTMFNSTQSHLFIFEFCAINHWLLWTNHLMGRNSVAEFWFAFLFPYSSIKFELDRFTVGYITNHCSICGEQIELGSWTRFFRKSENTGNSSATLHFVWVLTIQTWHCQNCLNCWSNEENK